MDLMEAVVSERETGSRSRDLLLRFSGGFSPDEASETGDADSDDIELGLSLGGCFNLSNSHKNRIVRTSSIPAILPPPLFPLSRACSLPEEESWMRKEMQCKKRMEVKRKREERRSFRRAEEVEDGPAVKLKRSEVEIEGSWTPAGCSMIGAYSPAVSSWTAGAPPPAKGAAASEAQGSVFSPGSSSSGGSELESRPEQGFEISGLSHASLIRSTSISTAGQNNNKSSPILNPISNDTFSRKSSNGSNDLHQRMVEEMPAVSTKGDGHNGRKIDGFLYRYGRGEEVRIVCVCHGSFHTPAEFVKHGGGGNVEHPLRHIVVNPSPASFS